MFDLKLPRSMCLAVSHSGSGACQEDSPKTSSTEQHKPLAVKYPMSTPISESVKYLWDNYRGQQQLTAAASPLQASTLPSQESRDKKEELQYFTRKWKTSNLQLKLNLCIVTCKHPLGTQNYKGQGVGNSTVFSEYTTSSESSDLLQKTWARGWEPERKRAGVGLILQRKSLFRPHWIVCSAWWVVKGWQHPLPFTPQQMYFLWLDTYLSTKYRPMKKRDTVKAFRP